LSDDGDAPPLLRPYPARRPPRLEEAITKRPAGWTRRAIVDTVTPQTDRDPRMSVLRDFPSRGEAVIADLLAAQAELRPDEVYARFVDAQWTFAEAAEKAWRMGNALLAEQVAPGESVSVWTPTSPDLLQTWFGINAIGAVYAPLNLAARGTFLQHALNVAKPRILVAHAGLVERLAGLDIPTLETVVVIGQVPEIGLPWRMIAFGDLLDGAPSTRPELEDPIEPWHDFALMYTSGTTGPSKGVRLSYASHRLYADSLLWDDMGPDDSYHMTLPLSHVAGTSTTVGMLQRGGKIVLPGLFDPKVFWDQVREFNCTSTFIIHAMILFLLDQPEREDDADNPLRYAFVGPLTRVEEFATRFGLQLYTGFGMTEVPVPLRSPLNPTNETTCGRPFNPDYELRLVDENDLEVPDGTPGELILRHRLPWVVNSGYKDMPEATAQAWRNGWFHTGDQMIRDPNGDFIFVDRTKDAIRRRGENISSYEVEAEVLSHEDVAEVAAVAVANPDVHEATSDQEVKIVVVPVKGRTIDPRELTEYLIPRMPRHMVPRYIEIADELPKSPSFKVQKAVLRDAGVTANTWDREAAGIRLKREQLV
jgi:carnitine-CoA ligase